MTMQVPQTSNKNIAFETAFKLTFYITGIETIEKDTMKETKNTSLVLYSGCLWQQKPLQKESIKASQLTG